jgi:hypothetical protein
VHVIIGGLLKDDLVRVMVDGARKQNVAVTKDGRPMRVSLLLDQPKSYTITATVVRNNSQSRLSAAVNVTIDSPPTSAEADES